MAKNAGFRFVRLSPELGAAILSMVSEKTVGILSGYVAIADIGGGTSDFCLCYVKQEDKDHRPSIITLAVAGTNHIGMN